jgi:hypothetical protein
MSITASSLSLASASTSSSVSAQAKNSSVASISHSTQRLYGKTYTRSGELDTYARWLQTEPDVTQWVPLLGRADVHVGWGQGKTFVQSVLSSAMLEPVPERVLYFGDLDLDGPRAGCCFI